MDSHFPWLSALVGGLVAIIGWPISHWLTLQRENTRFRKETIAKEIGLLLDTVEQLSVKVISYHAEPRSITVEREIKALFSRLSQRIQYLPIQEHDKSGRIDAIAALIEMKRASTGWHFEDEHDGPVDAADEGIAVVQLKTHALESRLLHIRSTCF